MNEQANEEERLSRSPMVSPREVAHIDAVIAGMGQLVAGDRLATTGRHYRLVNRAVLIAHVLELVDVFIRERIRQAEVDLSRKLEERQATAFQEGQSRALLSLASLADLVDSVVVSIPSGEDNVPLRALSRRIDTLFKGYGYSRVPTVGMPFDSRIHEMIEEREHAGSASGIIVEEASRGYASPTFVLQVARVIVAK